LLTSCPGTVDQKNPLQSGSSNMYGTNRVNSRTQFKTANNKIQKHTNRYFAVWRVQVAHLHSAARTLSSPSQCFQLSTNLDKDFFCYLWYCDKKQMECGLAWSVLFLTTSMRHHSGQNVVDSWGVAEWVTPHSIC